MFNDAVERGIVLLDPYNVVIIYICGHMGTFSPCKMHICNRRINVLFQQLNINYISGDSYAGYNVFLTTSQSIFLYSVFSLSMQ